MKLNTIARTVAAVILSFAAAMTLAGAASAGDDASFTPPYAAAP